MRYFFSGARLIIVAVLLVCFVVYVLLFERVKRDVGPRIDRLRHERHVAECQGRMRALVAACFAYRNDHGALPPSLQTLYREGYAEGKALMCPRAWEKISYRRRTNLDSDYFYLGQLSDENEVKVPDSQRPLIYDSWLADHGGEGVNICMADGSAMWDEGARWLSEYAAAHPSTGVKPPQDGERPWTHGEVMTWLVANQEDEGNWAVGRWGGSAHESSSVGVTGAAVLAFHSQGHTERAGQFKEGVRRAVAFLASQQRPDGRIGVASLEEDDDAALNHAIAALALSEAYAMSRYKTAGLAASRALEWTLKNQLASGGWSRSLGGKPDLETSVYCLLFLKSAQIGGLSLDATEACGRAATWIIREADGAEDEGFVLAGALIAAGVISSKEGRVSRKPLEDRLLAWPAASRGNEKEYLTWWWGCWAMFRAGGASWSAWNRAFRDAIPPRRIVEPADPSIHLSWPPVGEGAVYGRAHTTAMAILARSTYFRYLPILK